MVERFVRKASYLGGPSLLPIQVSWTFIGGTKNSVHFVVFEWLIYGVRHQLRPIEKSHR